MRGQVRVELEMRDGFAEVTTVVDLGPDLQQSYGPYLLTEVADVDALVAYVSKEVRAAGSAFLARMGVEVCEERIT